MATWSARHPWWTIGIWLLAVVLGLLGWRSADHLLTTGTSILTETDSRLGSTLIDARFGDADTASTRVICATAGLAEIPVQTAQSAVQAGGSVLLPGAVTDIGQCYEAKWAIASGAPTPAPRTPEQGHPTPTGTVVPGLSIDVERAQRDSLTLLFPPEIGDTAAARQQGGTVDEQFRAVVQDDLLRAERIAVPLALLILILVIRARFSPFIPIVIGGAAVALAVGLTAIVARTASISVYVVNMVAMLGLAVGIDYTLLIFERYREERRAGAPVMDAVATSSASAGHAVLASGLTVIVALAGMLFVPISVFRDIALGAMLVVLLGVVAALTVLPAMLRLLGERIDLRRRSLRAVFTERDSGPGFWERWSMVVTRHPMRAGLLALVVLGTLAFQSVNLERGLSPLFSAPDSENDQAPAANYWEQEVTTTLMSTVEVVIGGAHSDEVDQGIERLVANIGRDNDFTPIVTMQTNDAGDLTVVRALVVRPSSSAEAGSAVERLRSDMVPNAFSEVPADVFVTGPLALQWDVIQIIERWQLRIIGFVLGLSFVILAVVFRSIVVPLLATLMTLLSVSAAIGVLVLVVQEGHGASLLGLEQAEMIEVWVPIVLFSILFGLSMDYHVFLLSRIHEAYRDSGDTTSAIAFGVRSTGTIICGAALIMVVVFGCFATGQLLLLQQIGFGLAVAILIDAFLVRLILVPATMTLLGRWNWYLPEWLRRLPGKA